MCTRGCVNCSCAFKIPFQPRPALTRLSDLMWSQKQQPHCRSSWIAAHIWCSYLFLDSIQIWYQYELTATCAQKSSDKTCHLFLCLWALTELRNHHKYRSSVVLSFRFLAFSPACWHSLRSDSWYRSSLCYQLIQMYSEPCHLPSLRILITKTTTGSRLLWLIIAQYTTGFRVLIISVCIDYQQNA